MKCASVSRATLTSINGHHKQQDTSTAQKHLQPYLKRAHCTVSRDNPVARNTSGLKRGGTISPGRPKGSKNKATKEVIAFFQEVHESPDWQASALKRMLAGKAPHLETYGINKIGGKPVEKHEITGADGGPQVLKWQD